MSKVLLALTSAALIALSGCASQQAGQTTSASQAAISAEAQSALTAAQADVKEAKAKNALWTTAETRSRPPRPPPQRATAPRCSSRPSWPATMPRKAWPSSATRC